MSSCRAAQLAIVARICTSGAHRHIHTGIHVVWYGPGQIGHECRDIVASRSPPARFESVLELPSPDLNVSTRDEVTTSTVVYCSAQRTVLAKACRGCILLRRCKTYLWCR